MASKNSNIFPSVAPHAYRKPSEMFQSESQRSFGSQNALQDSDHVESGEVIFATERGARNTRHKL